MKSNVHRPPSNTTIRMVVSGVARIATLGAALASFGCAALESESGEDAGMGQKLQAAHDSSAVLCASAVQGANTIAIPNDTTGTPDTYVDEQLANVAGLTARMPLIPPHPSPFDSSQVQITNAWRSNASGNHSAIDYQVTNPAAGVDPGFPVTAIAPGKVITASWDPNGFLGNTVVIEHTAPDGTLYRSVYLHLRDGRTTDCQNSKAAVQDSKDGKLPAPSDPARLSAFITYMDAQDCSALDVPEGSNLPPGTVVDPVVAWGTETQTLQVNVGDTVDYGQVIGTAGSTGWGGIGFGLDAAGGVMNDATANNHLHFLLSIWDGSGWRTLDPYGAYSTQNSGCYALGAETEHNRLFAAHYPTFAGVSADIHSHYFDYYPDMGLGMQTASLYQTPRGLEVAGSYQYGIDTNGYVALGRTQQEFTQDLADNDATLSLRELSVVFDSQGTRRFSGIWSERSQQDVWTFLQATDGQFAQALSDAEAANGRLLDHFVYELNGYRLHALVVGVDGTPPSAWDAPWNLSVGAYDSYSDTAGLNGSVPVSVNAEQPDSTTFGGVFARPYGYYAQDVELQGLAGLQERSDQRFADGYRLFKIQGYNGGESFATIWAKDELRPEAVLRSPSSSECGSTEIELDGSATIFDPAYPVSYEWTGPFSTIKGTNPNPVVSLAPGSHTVQLRVFDSRGFQSIATQTVTVAGGSQVYEAENMFASTGGPVPGAWNLWSNGTLSTTHNFTGGQTSITVSARGEAAQGVSPHMLVHVDGVVVGDASVWTSALSNYTFSFNTTAGSKTITVSFDNDYYDPPLDDRNLIVDRVTVGCGSGVGSPCDGFCSNAVPISWTGSYQSGDIGTAPICREVLQPASEGNCGNFESPRKLFVNGVEQTCNGEPWSLPPAVDGGYCVQATDGAHPYGFFTLW